MSSGSALAQALDEAVVLDVVHAAVAGALGLLGDLLPERMLELGAERRGVHPLVVAAAAFDVERDADSPSNNPFVPCTMLMRLYGRGRFVQCCTMIVRPRAVLIRLVLTSPSANVLLALRRVLPESDSTAQSCRPRDGLLIETR